MFVKVVLPIFTIPWRGLILLGRQLAMKMLVIKSYKIKCYKTLEMLFFRKSGKVRARSNMKGIQK